MLNTVKCPICGGRIVEHKKSFSCENWKVEDGGCGFAVWKNNFGASFTEEDVVQLIQGNSVEKENISKAGNPYKAIWNLNEEKKAWFQYVLPEDKMNVARA